MIALLTILIIVVGIDSTSFFTCVGIGLVPCSSGEGISSASCFKEDSPCNDTSCIADKYVCNGHNDCVDGSDEEGCIHQEISKCHEEPSFCSGHECTNMYGPPKCNCAPGYRFSEIQNRCQVIDRHNASLTYMNQTDPVVGQSVFDLQDNYEVWHDMLEHRFIIDSFYKRPVKQHDEFWTGFALAQPYHLMPSTQLKRKQHYVLMENIYNVDGMAIDYVLDLIYWSDSQRNVIEVAKVRDPTKRTKLVATDLNKPKGIALNLEESFILFINFGANKIESIRTDGTGRRTVLDQGLDSPHAIALDPHLKKFYFFDTGKGTLNVADLDGQNRRVLLKNPMVLERAIDLDVFEDKIFFCDWVSEYLLSVDKFKPESTLRLLFGGLRNVQTCKVLHYSKQPLTVDDQCAQSDCEFLCLPRNDLKSHVCVCHSSSELDSKNNRTCLKQMGIESGKVSDEQNNLIIILAIISFLLLCIYALMRAYKRMLNNHHAPPDLETSLSIGLIRRFSLFTSRSSKWSH